MKALNRKNRIGLQFYLTELPYGKTQVKCEAPSKTIIVNAHIDRMNQGWFDWCVTGKFIQDAFPFLSDDEREFLITAITPKEWNEIFSEEER